MITLNEPQTMAAIARHADLPHRRAKTLCRSMGIKPDLTVQAGRGRMWLFDAARADEIADRLRRVAGNN